MDKNYKIFKFNVLTLIGSVLFFSNCFGANIYVNNAATPGDVYCTAVGNNANSGLTPALPKLTVAAAIGVASAGDIIYVDTGTYGDDSIPINKAVTIIGAGTGNTIFDNGNAAQLWCEITSSNVTIKNITITKYFNANASKGQVIDINGAYSNITLDGILITACMGASSTLPNIHIAGGANVIMKNSFLKCSGYNGSAGGGVLVNASTGTIQNCVFFQNESATSTENGGALQIKGATANVTVTNCSFYGCVSLKGGAIGQNAGVLSVSGSCFANNISETDDSVSGGGAIFVNGTSNTTITNCTFDTNAATNQAKGSSAITVGTATSADGSAICFRSVTGTASITNCSFTNNGKVQEVASGGVIGATLVNGFGDGQDIFYSGTSLNITISNNTFSSANPGEVNVFEESGNQTMSNNGIYTQTGSTGPSISTLLTTRTGVSDGTHIGWSDNHLTNSTVINMLGNLLTPTRIANSGFGTWIDNGILNTTQLDMLGATVTPIRTDVAGFATWADTGVSNTAQLDLKGVFIIPLRTGATGFGTWTDTQIAGSATNMTMTNNATTNYTPIRTDVFSTCSSVVFAGWTDTNITQGATCATGITTTGYLRLIQSTSSASSPTMDFSNSSAGKLLNFRIRQDGAVSGTSNVITVDISTDNGATWSNLGTRTAGSTSLTAVAAFDLSTYASSQVKIRFSSLGANGTVGVGIDDISITSRTVSAMITPALTLAANVTKSLNFKAAIISSANQTKNTITVSISTDNGSTWSVLGTRFHTNATSTAMAPFDLTSYSGSTIKIKFETLDADGTIGALLDDIAITSASNTITPALDFTSNTYSKYLTFKAGTIGAINTTYNTITVFASSDNGTTWTVLGTRTPTLAAATQMTLFNLSAYNSSNQVKLKFEVLGSDGTNAAFIDDIAVITASTIITPAMDFTATSALEFLTFKASRLNATANTDANTVTVSASSNNGATWTVLGTRTATVTGAPVNVMTPFDLSAYESFTQVKIKFEALSAFGTTGVSLDDIAITEASTMITPTLDFSNKGVQLVYTTALVSTANTTFQQVKVSISHDNGASWTALNTTTTAGTYTLDLSSYHSATTKIKFETPYANGTIGASLDNITFNSAAASNTNPVTSCISQSLVTGCNSTLDCANDPNPPVIIRCAPDATITDCSGNLPDYRTLLSTYDDCSVTITQSPAPGTALAALGNGTHIITFTVSDESASSPDATCTMILTLSGCAGCSIKTWIGSTWSPAGTPNITNEVVIDDTYNTTNHGNIECCKLTINLGKTLTVTSDMYAYVINEVVNNGTFTIENNGSLVQEAEGKTNTGNLIYKRITKQRNSDYVFWSSPVANYVLSSHITTGPKYIWSTTAPNANGTQGTWIGAPATLDLAQGVIVRGNSNFNDFTTTLNNYENTFTGVPNNGAVTKAVFRGNLQGSGITSGGATITAIDDNYNLIGNPYPSSISAKDFLIENNSVLTGAIAIWTHGTLIGNNNQSFYQNFTYTYSANNYNYYNLSGSVFSPGTDYYIGAGQGFFVTMIDDATASSGNVTFNNTMRSKNYTNSSTATTPNFFRNASNSATSANAALSHKLWIDIVGQNGSSNRTLIAYTDGATNQKDNLFDAITKPQNDLLLYSLLEQDRLVIQGKALPFDVSDQVPMGYFAPTAGNYTLALAFVEGAFNSGQVIYVKDNLLNSYHNLSESAYTFTTVAGENQNRFVIVYQQTLLNNEHFDSSEVNIIINDFIHIQSKENIQNVEIYDMLGKLIKNYSNVNATFWKDSFNYANGVYLVKITTQNKTTITQKVIK